MYPIPEGLKEGELITRYITAMLCTKRIQSTRAIARFPSASSRTRVYTILRRSRSHQISWPLRRNSILEAKRGTSIYDKQLSFRDGKILRRPKHGRLVSEGVSRSSGRKHPDTITAMSNRAATLSDQASWKRWYRYGRRCLTRCDKC